MVLYTPEQIAEILQVKPSLVYSLLKRGQLSGVRFGQNWRISDNQLQSFLQLHSVGKIEPVLCASERDDETAIPSEQNLGGMSMPPPLVDRSLQRTRPASKYDKLRAHLANSTDAELTLSFAAIGEIIGEPLPASAKKLRPWWSNDYTHAQGRSWLDAGWMVSKVRFDLEEVLFVKRP